MPVPVFSSCVARLTLRGWYALPKMLVISSVPAGAIAVRSRQTRSRSILWSALAATFLALGGCARVYQTRFMIRTKSEGDLFLVPISF